MNKLLQFEFDQSLWQQNQIELADTMRLMLYQLYPAWFEKLDYNDDRIFLEPALFYLFSDKSTIQLPIEQILYGYVPETDRPKRIRCLTDPFGLAHLPNFGVYQTDKRTESIQIGIPSAQEAYDLGDRIFLKKIPISRIPNTALSICDFLPFILYTEKERSGIVAESASVTKSAHRSNLEKAINLLQLSTPFFWKLVEQSTREIAVFNSPNLRSMGAISYYGTAFLNTEGQSHDEVFFIDDLAHQIGHLLFYVLTLKSEDFLKVPKTMPLAKITGVSYENREVYGAFHGLFTYTTILHGLQACLVSNALTEHQRLEAVARMGFYMEKFAYDLTNLGDQRIFTAKGQSWYDAIREGYFVIQRSWQSEYDRFDYRTQPYIFNFQTFLTTNFQTILV